MSIKGTISYLALLFAHLICNGQSQLSYIPSGEGVGHISFSPNGQYVATVQDRYIKLWQLGSEGIYKSEKIRKGKLNVSLFSADGKTIIKAIRKSVFPIDEHIILIEQNNIIDTLFGHNKEIISLKLTKDGKKLISASKDRTVIAWDMDNNQILFKHAFPRVVDAIAINHDDTKLAIATKDKKVTVKALQDSTVLHSFEDRGKRSLDLTFQKENDILYCANDDGTVTFYDLTEEPILEQNMRGTPHKDWVYCLSISPDNRFLASGSKDESLILWDMDKKERISRLSLKGRGSVVDAAFDPRGKYLMAAPFLSKEVVFWNIDNLNITPPLEYVDTTDVNPPQILITSPVMRGTETLLSNESLEVKGIIMDEFGLYSLYINGIKSDFTENGDFTFFLKLAPGKNDIRIEATDVNNNTAVKNLSVLREENRDTELEEKPRNFLVSIGIDQYEYINDLYNAVADAESVSNLLIEKYQFEKQFYFPLMNEAATKNRITGLFRSLISEVRPNDNLLIYYSGHGHFDELLKEGYFIPTEGNPQNENTYLSNSYFLKIIEEIRARHIFLVVDACFSGSLFKNSTRGFIENVSRIKSRWCLASGRLEYVSDGTMGTHSPFCQSFLDFLKNNAKDRFAVSELIQKVKIEVADKTDQTPLGSPLQIIGDQGGEFIFELQKD